MMGELGVQSEGKGGGLGASGGQTVDGCCPASPGSAPPRAPHLERMTNRALVSPAGPRPLRAHMAQFLQRWPLSSLRTGLNITSWGGKGPICTHTQKIKEGSTRGASSLLGGCDPGERPPPPLPEQTREPGENPLLLSTVNLQTSSLLLRVLSGRPLLPQLLPRCRAERSTPACTGLCEQRPRKLFPAHGSPEVRFACGLTLHRGAWSDPTWACGGWAEPQCTALPRLAGRWGGMGEAGRVLLPPHVDAEARASLRGRSGGSPHSVLCQHRGTEPCAVFLSG